MRRIVLIIVTLLNSIFLTIDAQNYQLGGIIKNTEGAAVSYATVCISNSKDSTVIKSILTKEDGHFDFTIPAGYYKLKIFCFSYQPVTKVLQVAGNTSINILLDKKSNQLNEVVVTGHRKMMQSRDGNIVVDVTQLSEPHESLGELMNKLPGVLNENNKSVSLYGTPATVYIDGVKQNSITLENYLRSMPSDHYLEVELVAIPDGSTNASSGAIINIKSKQKREDGYYLKFGDDNEFYRGHYGNAPDIFYMVKKKNIDYNTSLSYHSYYMNTVQDDSTDYRLNRNLTSSSTMRGRGNEFRYISDLNIHLDKGSLIKWNIYVYDGFEKPRTRWITNFRNNNNLQYSNNYSTTKSHDDLWSTNLRYENSDSSKVKIITSYGLVYGGLRSNNHYYKEDDELYLHSNLIMTGIEHIFNVDLTEKLGKHKIYGGTNVSYGLLNDNADYFDSSSTPTSVCNEKELIWSLWGGWKYNLSNKFSVRASVRSEYTNISTALRSMPNERNNYWDIFPSTSLTYNAKNIVSTIGFTSSITRPNYLWMIPGIRYENDFLYTKGNTDLKPAKQYAIIFNNIFFDYANLNIQYRYSKNILGQVYVNQENGIIESTYMNYADQKSFSVYMSLPFRFFKRELYGQITSSATYNEYVHFSSQYTMPDGRANHYWNFSETGYIQYNHDRFHSNVNALFYPKLSSLQLESSYRWSLNCSVAYDFFRKKNLTISANANDIFNTMKVNNKYYIGDVYKVSHQLPEFIHYISASVVYRFDSGAHVVNKYKEGTGNDIKRFEK